MTYFIIWILFTALQYWVAVNSSGNFCLNIYCLPKNNPIHRNILNYGILWSLLPLVGIYISFLLIQCVGNLSDKWEYFTFKYIPEAWEE